MKVGVDLDGTVADFGIVMRQWIQENHGIPINTDVWDDWQSHPNGPAAWRDLWDRGVTEDHVFLACPVLVGAAEGVQALRDAGHAIEFITYRPKVVLEDSEKWLRLFGFSPDGPPVVHCADDKSLYDWDVLIDDHPGTIARCLPRRAVLIKRPWNQDAWLELPSVSTWNEFVVGIGAL